MPLNTKHAKTTPNYPPTDAGVSPAVAHYVSPSTAQKYSCFEKRDKPTHIKTKKQAYSVCIKFSSCFRQQELAYY